MCMFKQISQKNKKLQILWTKIKTYLFNSPSKYHSEGPMSYEVALGELVVTNRFHICCCCCFGFRISSEMLSILDFRLLHHFVSSAVLPSWLWPFILKILPPGWPLFLNLEVSQRLLNHFQWKFIPRNDSNQQNNSYFVSLVLSSDGDSLVCFGFDSNQALYVMLQAPARNSSNLQRRF